MAAGSPRPSRIARRARSRERRRTAVAAGSAHPRRRCDPYRVRRVHGNDVLVEPGWLVSLLDCADATGAGHSKVKRRHRAPSSARFNTATASAATSAVPMANPHARATTLGRLSDASNAPSALPADRGRCSRLNGAFDSWRTCLISRSNTNLKRMVAERESPLADKSNDGKRSNRALIRCRHLRIVTTDFFLAV